MKTFAAPLVALALLAQPVAADEFEEVLEGALEAYRAGDLQVVKEDLDYASQLLAGMNAEALSDFLPEAQDGWTREDGERQAGGGAMGMFGGGTTASATYRRDGETFSLTLVADSPMVSGMAAMFKNMAGMGGGRVVRIQRQQFAVKDGQVQGVVGDSVLVQAEGRAETDDMLAHIEAMDLRALGDF
ncbi:MAG: hypothetical protein ACQEUZ_15330 [Pseudomonadota bacterium]